MFRSIPLGRIFGITVRIHALLVLLGVLLLVSQGPWGALDFALLIFVVLLHELGHSLVAQRLGVQVVDIQLWPLGGMARMSEMPESSRIEGWIAVAGPAVNFALAGTAALALLSGLPLRGPEWLAPIVVRFLEVNLALGVFNLLPAFPTDGGRILRAWLARKRARAPRDWLRATEIAVRIGGYAAFAIATLGCVFVFSRAELVWPGMALLLIAAFLWWTGKRELHEVRLRHGASPFAAIAELLRRAAAGQRGGARESASAAAPASANGDERGYSAAQIEELERFHGRLKSWPQREE